MQRKGWGGVKMAGSEGEKEGAATWWSVSDHTHHNYA